MSFDIHSDVASENQPVSNGAVSLFAKDRIQVPGMLNGLSPESYQTVSELYTRILEAREILSEYRSEIGAKVLPGNDEKALTPLTPSIHTRNLAYKREDLTATRAYKVRGAVTGMAQMMELEHCDGFLAASTGNHALGVLKAAELLRPDSVRIVVPNTTAANKLEKIQNKIAHLRALGVQAGVVYTGNTFDEARSWAMRQSRGEYYLDPYSDPWVVAGQGTIGLELYHQVMPYLANNPGIEEIIIISPIGGGGLLAGTTTGFKMASSWDPKFRQLNIRFLGVRLSRLDAELGDAIRVQEPAESNQKLFQALNIPIVHMDDPEMAYGQAYVKRDIEVVIEGASGSTIYPMTHDAQFMPTEKRLVICLLSGGNVN